MLVLNENIINPLRTSPGRVNISVGKTTYDKFTQYFLMIDNLAWLFRLDPSFVMLFPSYKALSKDGDTTNCTKIIVQKIKYNSMRRAKKNNKPRNFNVLKFYITSLSY